jgi:hypothetical protein
MMESKAFSSEVETGSRQENASKQNQECRSDFIETALLRVTRPTCW